MKNQALPDTVEQRQMFHRNLRSLWFASAALTGLLGASAVAWLRTMSTPRNI